MITFNNKVLNVDGKWIKKVDPLNPLNLPANTIRCRFVDGYTPTCGDTQTLVRDNIWDIYKAGSDWSNLFNSDWIIDETNLIAVLGANTTGVTKMNSMFISCKALTSVALFDTSSVTEMAFMFRMCTSLMSVPLFDTSNVYDISYMFDTCTSLTSVPLFDTASALSVWHMFSYCSSLASIPLFNTSNVRKFTNMLYNCTSLKNIPLFDTTFADNVDNMCYGCINVESGALALYQQMSTQTYQPSSHYRTFNSCGSNTTTGAAELAQIPSNWK